MRRRDWRDSRWRSRRCSSKQTCGAPCRSRSGSAGSAENQSAPAWSGRSRPFCGIITVLKKEGKRMRRTRLVLLALVSVTLTGCTALRDAFSPRANSVARANDQTLTVERLANWAGQSKQVPLDPLTLSRVSRYWVEYTLFAEALASGKDLRDSATVTAAMWPVTSRLKWQRFHDRLSAGQTLTMQQTDSAFQAGQYRVFQHILFQVRPPAAGSPAAGNADAQKHRQAEQLLPQARAAGARFAQLASRYSDDPGSKVAGGSLGLSTRGQFVPEFDQAAWELAPGAVSAVVKSQFGYHIIRRPPLAEVRDSFRVLLQERIQVHDDSVYVDSLNIKRKIEPVSHAADYVKAAVQDIDAARSSNRVLVKYRGGSLKVRDFVRWLGALDPELESRGAARLGWDIAGRTGHLCPGARERLLRARVPRPGALLPAPHVPGRHAAGAGQLGC